MKKFIANIPGKHYVLMLVLGILALPFKSLAQCACTPTSAFPTTVNGITISLNNTGSVTNYGANWPSCGLSAGPMWAGSAGPFTQTYTFSQPVNNVNYVITAASGFEAFSFSVGSGVLTTSQCGGTCPFSQVGNTFTCNGNDDGTTVVLSSSSAYTSITVTGAGGSNGSLVGLCVESIVLCPTPTISIIPSAAICLGASRTLTVTGGTSYTWTPAISLNTTSGATVIASPSVTTTYTVRAAGSGTCTTSAMTTISVTPSPTVTISPATANICAGSAIALTAAGGTIYTWSPAASLSNTNTANVTASPTVTTTYTVIGGVGTCTNSATRTVSVTPIPTLTLTPSFTTICAGSSATLSATGATTYTWNPAASLNNANLATVVASPTTTTTYTITGANGVCTSTAIATVSLVPVPTLTLIPGTATICAGSSATLSATGATTYTWNPAASLNNANLATVVASPTTTTNYTVTGANGICTNTALATVNVIAMPVLTITPQTSTICAGSSTVIAATGATTYTWIPGTGLNNPNLATVTASPASTTSYTITGANGVCTRTALATVNVVTVPTLTLSPATASICAGSSTTLSATGATTYTWNPATGLNNANLATVVASPTITTSYTVTGANGLCTNTAIATVSVIAIPVLTVSPQSNTICAGTSTTLTANGSATYTWSPATGLNTTSGGVVIASPASTTVYTVTAGVSTCTSSINATVTINAVPSLTLNPPVTSICPGTSATLTATGATSYTWNPAGSLSASNGSVVVASPATTTNYTITGLIGICTNTAVATVNVLTSPTIAVAPATSTICAGSSVSLTASGSTTYTWSPATGLSTTTGSVVVASPPVGTTVYTITGGIGTCTTVTQATVTVDAVPVLTLTPTSVSICAGTSATLSAAGATTYTWAPATTLSSSSGSSVTATPAATTIYTITGAINSCTATATTTVNVIANPTLNIVANTTVCAGTSATLTVNGAGTYTWSPAATLSSSTGSVVVASPATTQTYSITGTLNTCTATTTTTVTIVPRPVIVMGANADICSGTSAPISASGATTYSWVPSTGLSATTGATVNASPNATTVYTVTGTTAGCSSSGVSTVSVTTTPTLTAIASPTSVCRGTSAGLSASGATSYTWSPSGSLTNTNTPTTVANPVMTTSYTVIGANGTCVASTTVELVIIQTATAQAISMGDVCFGASTTIEATGGTSYSWLPVSGLVKPNAASTVVRPVATTIYTVTVGGTGLCPSTATVQVVVNPVPHVFAGRDTTINIDEFITLTGTGDVEVGFLAPTAVPLACNFCNAITVNPQEPTCYVLKGENGYGCIDFDTVCVTVTKDYNVYIPNAFTPNEDGNNDVFIPVGYGLSEIRLNIFDRWGVLIFTSNETSIGWDGSYKGKQCEQGVYVYMAEIKTMAGTTIERTGHVTLLPRSAVR